MQLATLMIEYKLTREQVEEWTYDQQYLYYYLYQKKMQLDAQIMRSELAALLG